MNIEELKSQIEAYDKELEKIAQELTILYDKQDKIEIKQRRLQNELTLQLNANADIEVNYAYISKPDSNMYHRSIYQIIIVTKVDKNVHYTLYDYREDDGEISLVITKNHKCSKPNMQLYLDDNEFKRFDLAEAYREIQKLVSNNSEEEN